MERRELLEEYYKLNRKREKIEKEIRKIGKRLEKIDSEPVREKVSTIPLKRQRPIDPAAIVGTWPLECQSKIYHRTCASILNLMVSNDEAQDDLKKRHINPFGVSKLMGRGTASPAIAKVVQELMATEISEHHERHKLKRHHNMHVARKTGRPAFPIE